jgi:hypothetical protein
MVVRLFVRCAPCDELIAHLKSQTTHMKQLLSRNKLGTVGNSKQNHFGKLIDFSDRQIPQHLWSVKFLYSKFTPLDSIQ